MRRVFAWFRSHPLTTICLVLIGFTVGTHLFANWRAEARWQRYCATARARGVKLTLAEFAPPEIPDAENFAKIPMLRAIFTGGAQRPMELPVVGNSQPSFGNPVKGERIDWKAWQKFFKDAGWLTQTTDNAPTDVLRALEHYAPQYKEWGEWRSRPRCRFPLELKKGWAMQWPHLGTLQDAAKLFALRMRAHLAAGDSAAAYTDFQDGFQAYRALENEPTLLSGLARMNKLALLSNAVGDGLAQHAWAEPELRAIADDYSSIPVGADYLRAFSSERGFGNQIDEETISLPPIDRARKYSVLTGAVTGSGISPPSWIFIFLPKRLYRDNQLRYNQYMDELCARVTADQSHLQPTVGTPTSLENLEGMDAYYFFLFGRSSGVFNEVGIRFVRLHTQLDETRLACALERFRTARGAYPQTLTELVPDFITAIPLDTFSQQPLIYRPKDGGTFLLYGVGKNRTDDGGRIDPKQSENRQPDDVWLYAPPPAL